MQPEGTKPYLLLGTGVTGKTTLIIKYNDPGKNRISLFLSDDDGKELYAIAQTSGYAAKRLFISVNPTNNLVEFYEVNLLPGVELLETIYSARQQPSNFSSFEHEMLLGGVCVDGCRQGKIASKLANLILGLKPITVDNVRSLIG